MKNLCRLYKNISGHFIQGQTDTVAKKKIIFVDKAWVINF